MSALCLRRFMCEAAKMQSSYFVRYFSDLLTQTIKVRMLPQPRLMRTLERRGPVALHAKYFCTAGEEEEEPARKKKKQDPAARKTIGSIGRKIPDRILHVIDDNREDLGNMHRADVIRLMDERGLKLVPVGENADPPVYRLMTGKQIHEEQIKLREKQKVSSKQGSVQIKELAFSGGIANHDLETKTKQVQHWIEKKHHVRITVQGGGSSDGKDKLDILDKIVESMPGKATFVYQPKLIKDGKAAMCVLRHLSEKELREYKQNQKEMEKDSDMLNKENGQADTQQPNELPQ